MATGGAPWASGPGEILKHELSLLAEDSDVNRCLAMLSIDNAVELTMKTFLGLPRRITGIRLSRSDYNQIAESFPMLLDTLERVAGDKLLGTNLGEIEWYHRLRNELYHQGNGLTVEKDKVDVYAELARLLFKNLFGIELGVNVTRKAELLAHFMSLWQEIEQEAYKLEASRGGSLATTRWYFVPSGLKKYVSSGLIGVDAIRELEEMRSVRNRVVHGRIDSNDLNAETIAKLNGLLKQLRRLREKTHETR